MAFANSLTLQVDTVTGTVRMIFLDVRGPINQPAVGIDEQGPISHIVADIAMPANVVQEIASMLTNAFAAPAEPPKAG